MKIRKTVSSAFILTWLCSATFLTGAPVRYEAAPGSKVKIDGESTIHDWTVEGKIVGGHLEIDGLTLDDTATAGFSKSSNVAAKVQVTIPVRSLKSGKSLMDQVMHDTMKQQQHPNIEYRLLESRLKGKSQAQGGYAFDTVGELKVAGVTRTNAMEVTVVPLDASRLKITGATNVKMTEFGMQPPSPKVALGIIKTSDDVKISFDWLVLNKGKTNPAPATATTK